MSSALDSKRAAPDGPLACMDVWGGNVPTQTTIDRPGLTCQIYSRVYQESEHGGDVYYLSSCASGRVTRFLLADVCGHGESAAATAQTLRQLMRRNVNRIRQKQLVEAVNRELSDVDDNGRFATALIGTWISANSHLMLSNAGHPSPLLFRRREQAWSQLSGQREEIHPGNIPLGIDRKSEYTQIQAKLEVGDRLLCYTDAITEAVQADGQLFSTDGLLRYLQSDLSRVTQQIVPDLLEQLSTWSPENLVRDDLTIMLFEVTARPVAVRDSLLSPFRWLSDVLSPPDSD
ncbi:MAG: PP2C family protein-serine/threonine phosphatase [Planctomycetaceae bacterium]